MMTIVIFFEIIKDKHALFLIVSINLFFPRKMFDRAFIIEKVAKQITFNRKLLCYTNLKSDCPLFNCLKISKRFLCNIFLAIYGSERQFSASPFELIMLVFMERSKVTTSYVRINHTAYMFIYKTKLS